MLQVRKALLQLSNVVEQVSGCEINRCLFPKGRVRRREQLLTVANIMLVTALGKITIRNIRTSISLRRNRRALWYGLLPGIRAPSPGFWWLNHSGFDNEALGDWNVSADFCGWGKVVDNEVIGDDFEVVFGAVENPGRDFTAALYGEDSVGEMLDSLAFH